MGKPNPVSPTKPEVAHGSLSFFQPKPGGPISPHAGPVFSPHGPHHSPACSRASFPGPLHQARNGPLPPARQPAHAPRPASRRSPRRPLPHRASGPPASLSRTPAPASLPSRCLAGPTSQGRPLPRATAAPGTPKFPAGFPSRARTPRYTAPFFKSPREPQKPISLSRGRRNPSSPRLRSSAPRHSPAPPWPRRTDVPQPLQTPATASPRGHATHQGIHPRPQDLLARGFHREPPPVSDCTTVISRRRRLPHPADPSACFAATPRIDPSHQRPGGALHRPDRLLCPGAAAGQRRQLPCAAAPTDPSPQ